MIGSAHIPSPAFRMATRMCGLPMRCRRFNRIPKPACASLTPVLKDLSHVAIPCH
jgi:hypothetical protein